MLTDDRAGYSCYAQLKNLSGNGMCIETEYDYRPGSEIDIRFGNPAFKSAPKKYHAIVKWCKPLVAPGSIGSFGVGVKYI